MTLVFSKLVTWMRGQEGTPDLRALAYMDEVFGYVPPSAAPPAKKPILTIFKQGRAFGLGLVLSTQNPVDLDYKAMSNAGTWLVGRLQTENDKARVLEGLRSAAGTTDVAALDKAIGGLGKRQFLLVSAKANAPRLLATRWAMSYLCGPLTKEQVATAPGDGTERRLPRRGTTGRRAPGCRRRRADRGSGGRFCPRARGGRDLGRAARRRRRHRLVSRPGRRLVARTSVRPPGSSRFRAFLTARVSLRYDDSAAGDRRAGGVRGGLRPARRRARPRTARRRSTTTTATSRQTPPAGSRVRPSSGTGRRGEVLRGDREGHPAPSRRPPPARAAAQPRAEARLATRRGPGGIREAVRRGRAGARRRGVGEDPRQARGEARPTGQGARAGAAARRGAGHATRARARRAS